MRALQHYTDLKDIKRVIVNTHAIDPQALVEYLRLAVERPGRSSASGCDHLSRLVAKPGAGFSTFAVCWQQQEFLCF